MPTHTMIQRGTVLLLFLCGLSGCVKQQNILEKKSVEVAVKRKISTMTLEEKVGQKIMLGFRYWETEHLQKSDITLPVKDIARIVNDNSIGGVILFGNNLKNRNQITTLTDWYASMKISGDIGLFIATDNEGGSVFRLPREYYPSYPGNMALAAAVKGGADPQLAWQQGSRIASDLLSVNINTNFSPVVDVNINPYNPVINVRAFADNVEDVISLAEKMNSGMHHQHMITAYKHFPGHGSTSTDSHTSLPRDDRARQDILSTDIAPYQHAIAHHVAPDMIMTAHIQYPALDSNLLQTINGEKIIVPATMSRIIQSDLLRDQLGFSGVTVSDALDMQAVTRHFSRDDAIEKVFSAGVDIALMPVMISSPGGGEALSALIHRIAEKIRKGIISEKDIDASVERILTLKQHYQLWNTGRKKTAAVAAMPDRSERDIADRSATVVINQRAVLPLKDNKLRYFILSPWAEQGRGIAAVMTEAGYQKVVTAQASSLTTAEIRQNIAGCDVFILGTMVASAAVTNDNRTTDQLSWLRYAAQLGKKRIHLSLGAPYDIVTFTDHVDAAVAVYSGYGYENGSWRGHTLIALTEILTGMRTPQGKLPITLWRSYDMKTQKGTIAFPAGHGLSW